MPNVHPRSRRTFSAVLLAVALLLTTAAPATAQPPLEGSGTVAIQRIQIDVIREAGPNTTEVRRISGTVDGTIVGTFDQEVTGVIHRSGLVTFNGTMTFTGTVDGCGAGTFTVGLTGRAQSGVPTADGSFRVINQAANTLGVVGTGTLEQFGLVADYTVRYRCR